jgi:hypothetical protein
VGGIRDLSIALGVALIVAAGVSRVARVRRALLGAVIVLALRDFLLLLPIVVLAIGLVQVQVRHRRPVSTLVAATVITYGAFRWGIGLGRRLAHEQLTFSTAQFVRHRIASSTSGLGPLQGLVAQWQLLGVIPGLVIAVFTPVWFAVGSPGTPGALISAFGALGWWMLLPAIAIGFRRCLADARMTTIGIWAALTLLAAAGTLLTVFQDAPRMRLAGLMGYFLLAAWGIDQRPAQVRSWTLRWMGANVVLVMLYLVMKSGLIGYVRNIVPV